jgi:diguanylate cyclase (GGDEF)-like protein
MRRIDPARLGEALEQLDQAVRAHADWQERLLEAIVHGLPLDSSVLTDGVHLGCRFNRWYFDRAPAELWGHPAYAALGVEHWRLHRMSDRLLRKLEIDAPVEVEEFDELIAGNGRLRATLGSLQQGIDLALRSVDATSGAAARSGLLPDLRAWRELAARGVQACSIAVVAVDGFRSINDAHGSVVGDAVLGAAVRRYTRLLRPFDRIYRHGEDGFVIALPGADLSMAQAVIRHVREAFASTPLWGGPDGAEISVTASYGLAALDPKVGAEESVERAEQALLLAKTAGGHRAISWDPGVTTGVRLPRLQLDDIKS